MSIRNRIAFAAAILLSHQASRGSQARAEASSKSVMWPRTMRWASKITQEAIRLHAEVVRERPDNALAHYHLGIAEGMMSDEPAEIREYQRAEELAGLRNWDLFLNMGLAQLENGDLDAATDSLRRAVLLSENHSESPFRSRLIYERRGLLADAEREMLASLRLNPGQPDARNSLGVIYAEEGKNGGALLVWRELAREMPDYEPRAEI